MALSTYAREALQNWKRGTAMPTAPAGLYISLHSGDPGLTGANELSGNGYARKGPVAFNAPIDIGSDEVLESAAAITFGPPTGSAWTVTYFGVWTALTGGNFIEGGPASSSGGTTVPVGTSYPFAAGAIRLNVR